MIICKAATGRHIYKSWRENGEKKTELVEFSPYFYVEDAHPEPREYKISRTLSREFEFQKTDAVSLDGTPLKKVFVDKSNDIYRGKRKFLKDLGSRRSISFPLLR